MLLVRSAKGHLSPRLTAAFGDHFASILPHSSSRKFSDEGKLFSPFCLLKTASLSSNGRTSW